MDEWTIKSPNPICRLFFKVDLLTKFTALCLTDFIDWRYIHSLVGIFDPACDLLPPMDEGTILVYCCPSIFSLTSPPIQINQTVCVWGGWGVNCAVDHILQKFFTLFLTRFRTYQIASLPQTKMTSKDDSKGLVSLKFLRPCLSDSDVGLVVLLYLPTFKYFILVLLNAYPYPGWIGLF